MAVKLGFLFGAGAEYDYGMPTGGEFAVNIFKMDKGGKQNFKTLMDKIEIDDSYDFLPDNYKNKTVTTYNKRVYEDVIKYSIEENRDKIYDFLNDIDDKINKIESEFSEKTFIIENLAEKYKDDLDAINIQLADFFNTVSYQSLFNSSVFKLFVHYSSMEEKPQSKRIKRTLNSIMNLLLMSVGKDVINSINENPFKGAAVDIFDGMNNMFRLDYSKFGEELWDNLKNIEECNGKEEEDYVLNVIQQYYKWLFETILSYKGLIDKNWHYLYNPKNEWGKFTKISTFLYDVRNYIKNCYENSKTENTYGYYDDLKEAINKKFKLSQIATTNYTSLIEDKTGENVCYLNGSTHFWYDPYFNKIGTEDELLDNHFKVPLIFTQSGVKPLLDIKLTCKYVELYNNWKYSDAIVIVGFSFSPDDEHINGLLRRLVDDKNKHIIVVDVKGSREKIAKKLKVSANEYVHFLKADHDRQVNGKSWVDAMIEQVTEFNKNKE